jgi:hypothetical protein
MQKVYNNITQLEKVLEELFPFRLSHLNNAFKIEFKISSLDWDKEFPIESKLSYIIRRYKNINYYISKATKEEELLFLKDCFDEHYKYSDDHRYWSMHHDIKDRIDKLCTS